MTGVRNESGKVQVFYRGGDIVSFDPRAVVPMEFAFLNGSVHPSLLAPPSLRKAYKRCGCERDPEEP